MIAHSILQHLAQVTSPCETICEKRIKSWSPVLFWISRRSHKDEQEVPQCTSAKVDTLLEHLDSCKRLSSPALRTLHFFFLYRLKIGASRNVPIAILDDFLAWMRQEVFTGFFSLPSHPLGDFPGPAGFVRLMKYDSVSRSTPWTAVKEDKIQAYLEFLTYANSY